MVHRSLMEPPGKAKKAETGGGGGGEPHHPHGAAHGREAMIEDSSLTGSKKNMSAQHHGSVGFLLASTALTGSVNKKPSIFGQGANHDDQAKTSIKKAVTGQKAQGAGPYAPPSPVRPPSIPTFPPTPHEMAFSFVFSSLQAGAMCFGRQIRGNRQRSSWSWTSIGT